MRFNWWLRLFCYGCNRRLRPFRRSSLLIDILLHRRAWACIRSRLFVLSRYSRDFGRWRRLLSGGLWRILCGFLAGLLHINALGVIRCRSGLWWSLLR